MAEEGQVRSGRHDDDGVYKGQRMMIGLSVLRARWTFMDAAPSKGVQGTSLHKEVSPCILVAASLFFSGTLFLTGPLFFLVLENTHTSVHELGNRCNAHTLPLSSSFSGSD